MSPTPASPHASHAEHDELLIVRLFGRDVEDAERERALAQLAGCAECASLFADLGATAAAMPALLVPSRPRDFTLTAQQAARLRPRRLAAFTGWTRPLGVALSGLGAAALTLLTVVSMLPSGGSLAGPATFEQNRAAPGAASAALATPAAMQGGVASACPPVCAPNDKTGGGVAPASSGYAVASAAATQPAQSSPVAPNEANTQPKGPTASQAAAPATGDHAVATSPPVTPQPASSSLDTRLAFGAAALMMLVAGLALLGGSFLAGRIRR